MAREEPSGSREDVAPRLDLIDASFVLRVALRTLRLQPWQIALAAFGGYYLLPLGFSAIGGTFLSQSSVAGQFAPLGIGGLADWLARTPGITRPYGTDLVHLSMATVSTLLGAWVALKVLLGFNGVFTSLVNGNQLLAPGSVVSREAARANRLLRSWSVRGFLFIASLVLAGYMVARTRDPAHVGWWGHSSHGYAGTVFAVFVWALIFFGGLYVYFLAVGLSALSRIFRHPVQLRPFHPDECNGFGAFGDYLLMLLLLSLLIAAALWITFWGGYLGIERFVLTWLGGLIAMVAIPIIAIHPLARLTMQIAHAREERLRQVEALLHERLEEVEASVVSGAKYAAVADDVEHLVGMRRAMADLYPGNVFPFRPRLAGTLSVGYALQVGAFVKQAMETFA